MPKDPGNRLGFRMLLFTLPLTPAFTAHAMGASTRPSRLASLKMALSAAPGLKDRIEHEVPAVQDFSKAKKVGVIGAGVAGLQAANELRKSGLEVKVFEKSAGLAGVWRENYDGFALQVVSCRCEYIRSGDMHAALWLAIGLLSCWPVQVPRELYEFPGYPYPDAKMREISGKGFSKFPQGAEVAEYTRMFVEDMELQQLISFQTSVTRIEPIAGGDGWAMHHGKQGKAEVVEQFDFVVVATGMYSSSNAHFPTTEGMDRFQGKVMHSCQFTDASVCQGKNVVVVGGGKSSIDCVRAAAKKGAKAASQASNLRLIHVYTHMASLYVTFAYAGRLSGLPQRALAGAT
jgi:cation diffusion facilitator CzcD-associated flavoprotein CzcO